MGNESKPSMRVYEPQLDLHSEINHPIHGPIRIYSSKALPMTFLMRLDRITAHSRLYNLFQRIQDRESVCMLTLYGFKLERQEGCSQCTSGDRTVEYWQYLNYTLKDHIEDRARRGVPFTYHQIWHIIEVVLIAIKLTQQVGLIWEVDPSLLEITPEGKLKANWSHLQMGNGHIHFLSSREEDIWWSPEELFAIQQRENYPKINFDQSNIYKFGLLVLSLANLTLEPQLNEKAWSNVLKCQYPIPQLISSCLSSDPRKRPPIAHLYQSMEENFNSSYELLISQNRREDLQQLQIRAQMLADHNRSSYRFSEIRQGSRYSEAIPLNNYKQSRLDNTQESYDHRLEALREYRRNLALSRNPR